MPNTSVVRPAIERRTPRGSKTELLLNDLERVPPERQRFALLLAQALGRFVEEADISESQARSLVYRMVQAGTLQERRAPEVRKELARLFGPSLADEDPVPHATVEQARRLAALRRSLLRGGAFSTAALAKARGLRDANARQWISRHRKSHRVFTVTHEGEAFVPAFLLDDEFEPKKDAYEAIKALREAGEDGWALWAWFALPSAWLDGRVPAEVLNTDPEVVAESARQRAASRA